MGAKRPSSPAGLAGRSAERACKLVFGESQSWGNLNPFLAKNRVCKKQEGKESEESQFFALDGEFNHSHQIVDSKMLLYVAIGDYIFVIASM